MNVSEIVRILYPAACNAVRWANIDNYNYYSFRTCKCNSLQIYKNWQNCHTEVWFKNTQYHLVLTACIAQYICKIVFIECWSTFTVTWGIGTWCLIWLIEPHDAKRTTSLLTWKTICICLINWSQMEMSRMNKCWVSTKSCNLKQI